MTAGGYDAAFYFHRLHFPQLVWAAVSSHDQMSLSKTPGGVSGSPLCRGLLVWTLQQVKYSSQQPCSGVRRTVSSWSCSSLCVWQHLKGGVSSSAERLFVFVSNKLPSPSFQHSCWSCTPPWSVPLFVFPTYKDRVVHMLIFFQRTPSEPRAAREEVFADFDEKCIWLELLTACWFVQTKHKEMMLFCTL